MHHSFLGRLLSLLFILSFLGVAALGETGHYPLGSEGIKAATLPPPGWYFRTYSMFYTADTLRDSGGHDSDLDLDLDAFAFAPRVIWITKQKILGADFGMDVLVPVSYTDFELDGVEFKDHRGGIGDIMVEPALLSWHGECYDISAGLALWTPTGEYDKNHAAVSPGKDFWTTMLTLGGTYYLDQEKTWSASLLNRYEFHSEQDHRDVRPGQNYLFEWGVAKTLAKIVDVGVVGYCQWQTTDDHGSDVTWDKNVHDRVAGIGPEISVAIPPAAMSVSLRCVREFSAVDRPEGTTVTLTLTKAF